jgi:peptidoglycan-associated lipoprotein
MKCWSLIRSPFKIVLKSSFCQVGSASNIQDFNFGKTEPRFTFKTGSIMMFQRILAIVAATFLLAACETASQVGGDSASTSASNTASSSSTSSSSSVSAGKSQAEKLAQVGDTVNFEFDSAELTVSARSTLNRQSAFLSVNPDLMIVIEGHADERGTREYNLALAERRATAVRDYLVAKGMNSARVRTVSYGKERPAVVGSDEASWAKNRRATTVLN